MQDKDVGTEEKETSVSAEVSNILNQGTEIMNNLRKKEVAHSERDINPKKRRIKKEDCNSARARLSLFQGAMLANTSPPTDVHLVRRASSLGGCIKCGKHINI